MTTIERIRYVFWRKSIPGGWKATLRAFWHIVIRRYDTEICGACGRPVAVVWHAPTPVWNYVYSGEKRTIVTVRKGSGVLPMWERAEGHGGILCVQCFDALAIARGMNLMWEPKPLE